MDAPPEQDSPKHILNALNAHCIEEIFCKISNVNDLLQAAQVCQQFQQSAQVSQLLHKRIVICDPCDIYEFHSSYKVPFDQAEAFLSIFGSQLKKLGLKSTSNQERDDKLFKSVANLAGKSLKELNLCDFDIDFEQTQFLALQELTLFRVVARNFNRCSQLKLLDIHGFKRMEKLFGSWYIQQMPLLVSVRFEAINDLTDDMFAEFLSLNPQLEKLNVRDCNFLSASTLRTICTHSQNLVDLHVNSRKIFRFPELDLNMLGTLQKLTRCTLNRIVSVDAVINAFASSNVPIEYLHLSGDRFSDENLMTINTLISMRLDISNGLITLPKNLLRTQPALTRLWYINENGTSSMSEVEKLLKYGKNLKYFYFGVQKLNGNLASYESLSKAVRGRVIVVIRSKSGVDVPKTFLRKESKANKYLTIYPTVRFM